MSHDQLGDSWEFARRAWPACDAQLTAIEAELDRWLEGAALAPGARLALASGVREAVDNAVRHAYRGDRDGVVELAYWTESNAVCVEVVDAGRWPYFPDTAGRPGSGIDRMHRDGGAVLIRHDERGTRVLLRQPLTIAAQPARLPEPRRGADGASLVDAITSRSSGWPPNDWGGAPDAPHPQGRPEALVGSGVLHSCP